MLAVQRKRKRTESGKNTKKGLEKDTVTKRDRVSTTAIPKPQAHTGIEIEEEKSKCH